MGILIPAGSGNNKQVGIRVDALQIWAYTGCCGAEIHWYKNKGGAPGVEFDSWECSKCQKRISLDRTGKHIERTSAVNLDYAQKSSIQKWAAFWVGVPVEQVQVDIS